MSNIVDACLQIAEQFKIPKVRLVNDFAAAGYGLLTLDIDTECVTLQVRVPEDRGPKRGRAGKDRGNKGAQSRVGENVGWRGRQGQFRLVSECITVHELRQGCDRRELPEQRAATARRSAATLDFPSPDPRSLRRCYCCCPSVCWRESTSGLQSPEALYVEVVLIMERRDCSQDAFVAASSGSLRSGI